MKINYWDCEFSDYDEYWDGEEELRTYGCTHPKGIGICRLDNKYADMEDNCKLLDKKEIKNG